jgi:hypothetical protein
MDGFTREGCSDNVASLNRPWNADVNRLKRATFVLLIAAGLVYAGFLYVEMIGRLD